MPSGQNPKKAAKPKKDNPHAGHRKRIKQRFLEEGLDSFADHEALEMLLYYALPQRDTNGIAHDLIQRFGTFSGVLDADISELVKVPKIGENAAVLLTMLPEFFRRYQIDHHGDQPLLANLALAGDYVSSLYIGKMSEEFYLICLNARRELLKTVCIGEGTISEVPVYPRTAVEAALRFNAHSVILAHNHPSGNRHPSAADVKLTNALINALATVDIRVLDHIIICGSSYVSMADLGLIRSGF